MSNLMITLLVVFAFAAGIGIGLIVRLRPKPPSYEQKLAARQDRGPVESTVHFGRSDDDDHPHDIERQGSLFPLRDAAHRYDGMTDGEAPHVPVGARGLDFGSTPR